MKLDSRCTTALTAVVLAVLPAACSASAPPSDAAPSGAVTSSPDPSSTSDNPAPTAPDNSPSQEASDLVEWITLACISMSPGEPMEIIDPTVVRADNRATLAELAQTAAEMYDTQLDLLSDLPEPPTREAKAYVTDFRKSVKGAKSSWMLVASSAESKDVSLKDLRTFVEFAGMTTMGVNTPLPPEPGPLAEAYAASWRCGVR